LASDSALHYTDVKTCSDIPEELAEYGSEFRLYWEIDGVEVDVTDDPAFAVEYNDTDQNGIDDQMCWVVPQLSEQNFTISSDLSIINVQSFPVVGGEWVVKFTTIGTGDLVISGVDGTTFGDSLPDDLKFLELNNGTHTLSPTIVRDSVIFPDYSSDQQGFASFQVLTSGKHDLEFRFGTDIDSAHNLAGSGVVLLSVSKGGTANEGFQLREIDPTDASTKSAVPIKIGDSLIDAASGLATNPSTGEPWAIVKDSGAFPAVPSLGLVSINPFNGEATVIGALDDFYVSLAFDSAGTLYTAKAADIFINPVNTLYTLSPTDATATPQCAFLSNGFPLDEKALGFNPNDPDFIYYVTGGLAPPGFFQKIDTTNFPADSTSPCVITNIPIDLAALKTARAITFSESEGKFLWSKGVHLGDTTPGNLISVNADGTSPTIKGLLTHPSKGLAFVEVNGLPTAFDDLVTTDVDAFIDISVLANDVDPEDDSLVIDSIDTTGTLGTVTSPGAGIIRYTPPAGFSGSDSFTYTIDDGITDPTVQRFGGSLTATVTVFTIKVPTILSLIANDPAPVIDGYSAGDTMILTFSEPVNRAAGETLTSDELDDLLIYRVNGVDAGEALATNYDGVFETPSRLRINIITPSSFTPVVGTFSVSVEASANLKNAAGTSQFITDESDPLTGDFGAIAGPLIISAVIDDPDGTPFPDPNPTLITENDTITIRFDRPTNTPGGSGIQDKAEVDALFEFVVNPPVLWNLNFKGHTGWQSNRC